MSRRRPFTTGRRITLPADPSVRWWRLLPSAALLGVLLAFGTLGYIVVEGWSVMDAFYMTVITVTTVGYFEVQPLSEAGRVLTIFVILFGVGAALYILTTVVQTVVEGEFAEVLVFRRMKAQIEALRDHHILCGFGRVGEEIARELVARGASIVVVENNEGAVARARHLGYLLIEADATQDSVLEEAGIHRARSLMAASDSDADNTFITISAKALNPAVLVVARVGHPGSEDRVRRAGADAVISPYRLAGRRMVLSALQPLIVDFMDLFVSGQRGEQILGELVVSDDSLIRGQSSHDALHDLPTTTLLAVQHADGEVLVGPSDEYNLRSGDRLMLLGSQADIELLGRTREHAPSTPAD